MNALNLHSIIEVTVTTLSEPYLSDYIWLYDIHNCSFTI